jgi:hypothetical protein
MLPPVGRVNNTTLEIDRTLAIIIFSGKSASREIALPKKQSNLGFTFGGKRTNWKSA